MKQTFTKIILKLYIYYTYSYILVGIHQPLLSSQVTYKVKNNTNIFKHMFVYLSFSRIDFYI